MTRSRCETKSTRAKSILHGLRRPCHSMSIFPLLCIATMHSNTMPRATETLLWELEKDKQQCWYFVPRVPGFARL